MEDENGCQDGGDGEEAEPEREIVGIKVRRYGIWVGIVAVVIVSCPSETNAVGNTVDIVLWEIDIEELNDGELLGRIVWGKGGTLCNAKKGDESGDPNRGAGVWSV